jgi:coproporphyrinogen III oxidase
MYTPKTEDDPGAPMRERMAAFVHRVQDQITEAIEAIDGSKAREDIWQRPEGGGGRSRVLQDGEVFEKAGVNVSVVMGELSPQAAARMGGGTEIEDLSFFATGVSLVFHPHNPMAPTVHANYRYFERGDGSAPGAWWFGGGADLTPSYLFEEDAVHFHQTLADACGEHGPEYYPRFKKWCDEYFYIPHREEARGVGGIFFDDVRIDEDQEKTFAFVRSCAAAFLPSYLPVLERRKDLPFEEHHKQWQQLRRGRYVEFNLVHDRGTQFGLRSQGRIESILMSLPLTARWQYEHSPAPGSPEDELWQVLKSPRSWIEAS